MRNLLIGLSLAMMAMTAVAQPYPNKPIRMVVPYPPGGGTDALGRIMAERLSDRLGQPVVVANVPGGSGTIGSDTVRQRRLRHPIASMRRTAARAWAAIGSQPCISET